MSGAPSLALVEPTRPDSWPAALEAALRPEFLATPLVVPPGSSLTPPECGVEGCPRCGETAPWGRFDTRLCGAHHQRWVKDGKPACRDWLWGQLPPRVLRPIERCSVVACVRSVECAGLCGAHRSQWVQAGRPVLERFASSAGPVASGDARCRVADCQFPCVHGGRAGLCDAHSKRFHTWRQNRAQRVGAGRSVERYLEYLSVCGARATLAFLALPDAQLVALELRFVLQHRHDEGGGFIHSFRWSETVGRLNTIGAQSLLDDDWHERHGTSDGRRVPSWMFYVNYARKVLLAFRGRCGLDDPWARDEWHIPGLPVDDVAIGRLRNLDWRPIGPAWLRELSKRWARHRLRAGTSTSHINGVRLAVVRLIEFCELQGWPLDDPSCLTRELFDAFLDHVRFLEASAKQKHRIAYGVKQLLEESHDLGWISLRHPRVYLRGELPTQRQWLPRALPAEVMVRLNEPRSLEQLTVGERAAVLVLMDCGLRATDTVCLKIDAVISGSDGAPYLRYWNHKRRREAVVPLSGRASEAIAGQRAWVRERYPDCEWLFPRLHANGRGKQPMGYSFIFATLRRWAEALDLRDEHGEPSRPSPHAFRHTYATGLVNNDVDLFSVQSLLDHDSPEMTWRYARLSNETLRRKWEQGSQRINIRGEIVALDLDGELSDAAWAKEQIARAKQTLPNGYCGLPLQQTCPHPNACLTCPAFLTEQSFLPQHREQLGRTEQLIELGRNNGNDRLVQINEATRVNLIAIIERAEQLERDSRDDQAGEEEGDGAA